MKIPRLRDLSIRTKLISAYLIVAVLLATLFLISIHQMSSSYRLYEARVQHVWKTIRLLDKIKHDQHALLIALHEYLRTPSEKFKLGITRPKDETWRWLESYAETEKEEVILDFHKKVKASRERTSHLVALIDQKAPASLLAKEEKKVHLSFDVLLSAIEKEIIRDRQDLSEAKASFEKNINFIVGMNLISVPLGAIFLILFGYFITNTVSRRLNKLVDGTIAIMQGNLELKIPEESKDEIGMLAESFNQMTIRLKDLTKGLEKMINERTTELQQTVADLEKARKASLNIMEDLQDSKSTLENKVNELNRSRLAMLHILKDIEASRKETHALYEKLKVVDRMKTEFLSMVSHELRTPITPIKGYLTLLLGGKMGELSSTQKEALNILNRQSEHLQDLIDSLLDISRLELGKPIPIQTQPLSLKKIIEDVVEAEKIGVEGRKITIKLEGLEMLPTIIGDEIKLKRVFTNLVGNAVKFTPRGGEIIVRAKIVGKNIGVEVVDNGIGIAREYLEKIFEKFFQVDSSYTRAAGGIGMGLAIAKELIELHGGKIWAESNGLGKGSRFIFTLPVTKKGGNKHGQKGFDH